MGYQMIFKRYELKYLLTMQQKEALLRVMEPYMALDQYGHSTIRNIYYDTDNFRLVRHSIEHPAYKEKLRVRSYSQAGALDQVFVELKKKYRSVVYKRRMSLPYAQAESWLGRQMPGSADTQIAKEIDYFLSYYKTLQPMVFLSYEREAFYTRCGDDFRVTFDNNILARSEGLSLGAKVYGTSLLAEGLTLMEIKTAGGIPLWMSHFLAENKIYKTSFSKYGTAYQTMIYPNGLGFGGGRLYA